MSAATLVNTILTACPGSPGGVCQVIVTKAGLVLEFGEMTGSLFRPYDREFLSFTTNPELCNVYAGGVWNAGELAALVESWCGPEDGEDE